MTRYTFIFLLFFSFISCQTLPDLHEEQPSPEPTEHYSKRYNFTTDWFSTLNRIPVWKKMLRPFKGKPEIHYLEIGVYEGRSAIWMLENILTHPSSRLTGIDIFWGDLKERYLSNLKISGFANKAKTIEGASQSELRRLPLSSFDIIYIDGCHRADCVLSDAALSFELLKPGGILIFDDYAWSVNFPEELLPQSAIDSFITAYRNYIEIIHRGYQVFIKKREDPCAVFRIYPTGCSTFGQYMYGWYWDKKNELYRQETGETVALSDKERNLIEKLIKSTKFGRTELFLDRKMLEDSDFKNLSERLKLDFSNIKIE